jgi:hypothetical protein
MQEKTTLDSLRRKLATLSGSSGLALSAYDVDRFLSLGPYYFYDAALDGPPRVAEVERLVLLGIPRWPLINQETVNETFALLDARPLKGLASAPQARLLRERGTPRPWNVRFTEVGPELCRLKGGKKAELTSKKINSSSLPLLVLINSIVAINGDWAAAWGAKPDEPPPR